MRRGCKARAVQAARHCSKNRRNRGLQAEQEEKRGTACLDQTSCPVGTRYLSLRRRLRLREYRSRSGSQKPLLSSTVLLILRPASIELETVSMPCLFPLYLFLSFLVLSLAPAFGSSVWAEERVHDRRSPIDRGSQPAPVIMKDAPPEVAEGSNKCEIVSCGMGIKDTCEISCPSDKTPKCSCDCIRNIGPLCMEYKANCRCE